MKFFGKIGFTFESENETEPGIWTNLPEEHEVYGDVLSNVRRWEAGTEVNSDLTTSNRISILADRFLCEHLGAMRYVNWNGTVWEIRSVELIRPRAILTLGGVYNGVTVSDLEKADSENPSEETPDET